MEIYTCTQDSKINIETNHPNILEQNNNRIQKCKLCGTENSKDFESPRKLNCITCNSENKKKLKEKAKNQYKEDPDCRQRTKDRAYKSRNNNIYQYKYTQAKNRALRKKIEFNITAEYIAELHKTQNYLCRYSKLYIKKEFAVDRIDSKKGYTRDNVVLVNNAVNSAKNNMILDEYIYMIKKLYENVVSKITPEKLQALEDRYNNELLWTPQKNR